MKKVAILISGLCSVDTTKQVGGPGGPSERVTIDFRSEAQGIINLFQGMAADYYICTNPSELQAQVRHYFRPVEYLESTDSAIGKRLQIATLLQANGTAYDAVVVTRFDIYMLCRLKIDFQCTNFISQLAGDDVCDNMFIFPMTSLAKYIDALHQIRLGKIKGPAMHHISRTEFGRDAKYINNERVEVWRLVSYWIRPGTRRPFLRFWTDYTDDFTYVYDVRPSTFHKVGDRAKLEALTEQGSLWGELCQQGTEEICFDVTSDADTTLVLLKRRGQFNRKGMGLKHSEFKYPTDTDETIIEQRYALLKGVRQRISTTVHMHWPMQAGDVGSGFWIAEFTGKCSMDIRKI